MMGKSESVDIAKHGVAKQCLPPDELGPWAKELRWMLRGQGRVDWRLAGAGAWRLNWAQKLLSGAGACWATLWPWTAGTLGAAGWSAPMGMAYVLLAAALTWIFMMPGIGSIPASPESLGRGALGKQLLILAVAIGAGWRWGWGAWWGALALGAAMAVALGAAMCLARGAAATIKVQARAWMLSREECGEDADMWTLTVWPPKRGHWLEESVQKFVHDAMQKEEQAPEPKGPLWSLALKAVDRDWAGAEPCAILTFDQRHLEGLARHWMPKAFEALKERNALDLAAAPAGAPRHPARL